MRGGWDWDAGDGSAQTVYQDDRDCNCVNRNFRALINQINDKQIPYFPLTANSNSVAYTLLTNSGMRSNSYPDHNTVGWGNNLLK
jgi:hypothetical protein